MSLRVYHTKVCHLPVVVLAVPLVGCWADLAGWPLQEWWPPRPMAAQEEPRARNSVTFQCPACTDEADSAIEDWNLIAILTQYCHSEI